MKRSLPLPFAMLMFCGIASFVSLLPAFAQGGGSATQGSASELLSRNAYSSAEPPSAARGDNVIPSAVPGLPDSRIGPDDLLNITVFEAPEMNAALRVSADGDISMELLGEVHAAGLTPSELQNVLQGLLRRTYMKDPHVGVFIQELQSHAVSVVGAVKMPGVFQIRGPKPLLEILSMAQGLADDAGDTVSIVQDGERPEVGPASAYILKTGGPAGNSRSRDSLAKNEGAAFLVAGQNPKIESINLKKLLGSSDSFSNVLVHPGDVVKVSRAGIVYVVGEVNKPGGFVLQNNEGISILQALALAQGTTHTSAIRDARIIRTDLASGKRQEIPVNLAKIFSGKRPDILLEPKDVVFVPNSAAKSVFYRGSETALQTAAGVAIYKW